MDPAAVDEGVRKAVLLPLRQEKGPILVKEMDGPLGHIHLPHGLSGLVKGDLQPLVDLLQAALILFKAGDVGGGGQHDGQGVLPLHPHRPDVPPGPVRSVQRDPVAVLHRPGLLEPGAQNLLQVHQVVRVHQL